jgi:two-component system, NtrC family, nitrogen regulation sensor histidine kinase NtrY
MEFNWRSPLFTRIAILLSTVFAFAFVVHDKSIFNLLPLGLFVAIAFQVAQLIKSVEQPTGDFSSFFKSMRFDETTFSYKTDSQDVNTKKLQSELNEALTKLKNLRVERDSEYQFFKNIVQHVGIGILTFKKDGSIQIINSAAKRLLRVTKADTLQDLKEISEPLVDAFRQLKTGGRELIRIKTGDESVQLSIFAIELTLRGDELKLISMSNIQNELEEKEMEAWQNLVRVLTHEIMNSVTPISSLAGIVEEDLKHRLEREPDHSVIKKEDLEDMHLSLLTITKRSEGLIHFVREFRNLTHIPKPKITPIEVKRLLEELATLHKKELADAQVTISINIEPMDLVIQADKSMIEQVLINLIKNAIQSFDEQVERKILLSAYVTEKPVITVRDTGPGIEPEALEKIFIPFFSTKKTGSGIGLSLSRQIMRQHEGSITVKSTLREGTEFFLRF